MFEGIKKTAKSIFADSVRVDKIDFIQSHTKDTQSMSSPEEFFHNSLFLNKAIAKRAEVLSGIRFKAVDEDGEVQEDYQDKLENPNELLSGRDLISLIQQHYDVYGEFFLYKEPQVNEDLVRAFHVLNPKRMEVKIEQGQIQGFEWRNTKTEKKRTYDKEEIIWQHRPNPHDFTQPQSLVTRASRDTLRAEIELREYQAKVARSGGRFDSVVSVDKELSEKDLKEMKKRYKRKQNQAKRSKEGTTPFFAGVNTNVESMDRSPKELDYLESKRSIMEEVSTITGVPRTILSTFENIKYSNAEEARKTFLKETIKPLADKLAETLTKNLPEDIQVTYEDFIPEDHEEKIERLQTGAETGALSPNEIRQALGLEELDMEEADKPFVNMNKVPIDETSPQL